MKKTLYQNIQIYIINHLSKIHWKKRKSLKNNDLDILREKFTEDYYIVGTRRSNYLTTFLISLGNFFLTGRWGYYSHVLMNLEDIVVDDLDYKFIEATGKGTHYSTFNDVVDGIDAIVLLKPKNITIDEWTSALDKIKIYLGTPYDNLFDLKNTLEINCVELIRLALHELPDYNRKFANFERMVREKKKLTPDMFIECDDFEIVIEIRR